MKFVFPFLLLSLYAEAQKPDADIDMMGRIINGHDDTAHEFTFMTSLHIGSYNTYPSCGGSLVAANIVLTAAHCDNDGITGVRVGSLHPFKIGDPGEHPRGVERRVIDKIVSPYYTSGDQGRLENDFMLLVLDNMVDTRTYTPVGLNFDAEEPSNGEEFTVIGFGNTHFTEGNRKDILQVAEVSYVNHATCNAAFDNTLTESVHFCAGGGGKDSCQGDSGGPIFQKGGGGFVQSGVVSFGIGCAMAQYPGVYARTSGAQDWLTETICSKKQGAFVPSYCLPHGNDNDDENDNDDDSESDDDETDDDATDDDDGFLSERDEPTWYIIRETTFSNSTKANGGIRDDIFLNMKKHHLNKDEGKSLTGSYSLRLKKKEKMKSVTFHEFDDYSELKLDFSYMGRKFNVSESDSFVFDLSFDNDTNVWGNRETELTPAANNVWYNSSLTVQIPIEVETCKFRFSSRLSTGARLFIDDVTFSGYTGIRGESSA